MTKTILSAALKQVFNRRLTESHLLPVWRDDHTWQSLAQDLVTEISGTLVMLDRKTYLKLVADAAQMKRVREAVDAYQAIVWQGRKGG